ncbi:Vesicle trafficking between the ER and Golgi, partial [Dimargaris verticillata]
MDAPGPVSPSLRDKQVDAIISLLNLNHGRPQPTAGSTGHHPPNGTTAAGETTLPTWKILVFDRFAQDMISTLLKVNDLRENGITVH